MVLLDTNALIWLDQGHRRAKRLSRAATLYVSPATLLELQFLHEAGRIRLHDAGADALVRDRRWLVDEPPAGEWFLKATDLLWTRDPFDRLIVAHAQLRGWTLATGDTDVLEFLGSREAIEL